jgi:hypothetical protein
VSAQTEAVALQPKAPFIGTRKNFEKYAGEWSQANRKNAPFLPYDPDVLNGGQAPMRVQPATTAPGITEGLRIAQEDLQATTGIYNSSLGAESNETSGKAITARQREGDTGTYVYVENFGQAIAHTGRIIVDLIPHVYDTERELRIIGEDGKEEVVKINQASGIAVEGVEDVEGTAETMNDVTVGLYDVVTQMGASYNTRREDAREGMIAFLQSAGPEVAPMVLDLIAKAQDWPMADQIAERLEALLPPAIKALEDERNGKPPAPPPPPSPQEQAQAQAFEREAKLAELQAAVQEGELMFKGKEIKLKEAELELKAKGLVLADTARATAAAAPAPTSPSTGEGAAPAADPRIDELAAGLAQVAQTLQGLMLALDPVFDMVGQAQAGPPPVAVPLPAPDMPPGAPGLPGAPAGALLAPENVQ